MMTHGTRCLISCRLVTECGRKRKGPDARSVVRHGRSGPLKEPTKTRDLPVRSHAPRGDRLHPRRPPGGTSRSGTPVRHQGEGLRPLRRPRPEDPLFSVAREEGRLWFFRRATSHRRGGFRGGVVILRVESVTSGCFVLVKFVHTEL